MREIILTSLIDSTVKVITPQRIVHVHPGYTVATWAIWQARSKRTWRSCRYKFTFNFKTNSLRFLFKDAGRDAYGLMFLETSN